MTRPPSRPPQPDSTGNTEVIEPHEVQVKLVSLSLALLGLDCIAPLKQLVYLPGPSHLPAPLKPFNNRRAPPAKDNSPATLDNSQALIHTRRCALSPAGSLRGFRPMRRHLPSSPILLSPSPHLGCLNRAPWGSFGFLPGGAKFRDRVLEVLNSFY